MFTRGSIKIHSWRFLSTCICGKISFFLEAKDACKEHHREFFYSGIVILNGIIEVVPGYLDPVFSPFQLCLQVAESFCGFQFRILFNSYQKTANGSAEFTLCFLELSDFFPD